MHRLRGREVGRGSSTLSCPLKYGGTVPSPWSTDKGGRDFLHIASALHKCMLFMQRRFVDLTFFLSIFCGFPFFFSFLPLSLLSFYFRPPNILVENVFFSSREKFVYGNKRNASIIGSKSVKKKEIVETVDEFSSCNANFSNK